MKVKMTALMVVAVLAMVAVSYAGGACCAAKAAAAVEPSAEVTVSSTSVEAAPVLCDKCGQVAGSEACCKEGAELCPKCGKHAGSPGCITVCCKDMTDAEKKAAGCPMMKKMGCAPKAPEAAPATEEAAAPAE